jgi:hypothetical protein
MLLYRIKGRRSLPFIVSSQTNTILNLLTTNHLHQCYSIGIPYAITFATGEV